MLNIIKFNKFYEISNVSPHLSSDKTRESVMKEEVLPQTILNPRLNRFMK